MARLVSVKKLTPQQLQSGRYQQIDGMWHKLCSGPAHDQPELLPANDKYFIFKKSDGRPVARCRLCHNWSKLKNPTRGSLHGYVPVEDVRSFYIEAVNRIGVKELANRSGVSIGHILRVLTEVDKKFVEKATLRKIMLELVSMQRKGEFAPSKHARWRTDRRNNGVLGNCKGCGGILRNITRGCTSCYDRYYRWFKDKRITKKQWESAKLEFSVSGKDLIMGFKAK
jgi:hypothetical protein